MGNPVGVYSQGPHLPALVQGGQAPAPQQGMANAAVAVAAAGPAFQNPVVQLGPAINREVKIYTQHTYSVKTQSKVSDEALSKVDVKFQAVKALIHTHLTANRRIQNDVNVTQLKVYVDLENGIATCRVGDTGPLMRVDISALAVQDIKDALEQLDQEVKDATRSTRGPLKSHDPNLHTTETTSSVSKFEGQDRLPSTREAFVERSLDAILSEKKSSRDVHGELIKTAFKNFGRVEIWKEELISGLEALVQSKEAEISSATAGDKSRLEKEKGNLAKLKSEIDHVDLYALHSLLVLDDRAGSGDSKDLEKLTTMIEKQMVEIDHINPPGRLSFSKKPKPLTEPQKSYAKHVASIAASNRAEFLEFRENQKLEKVNLLAEQLLYKLAKAKSEADLDAVLNSLRAYVGIADDDANYQASILSARSKLTSLDEKIDLLDPNRFKKAIITDCTEALEKALSPSVQPAQPVPVQPRAAPLPAQGIARAEANEEFIDIDIY
jgi:hypothetical protein